MSNSDPPAAAEPQAGAEPFVARDSDGRIYTRRPTPATPAPASAPAVDGEELPTNETLKFIGGLGRIPVISKYRAVNHAQLKETIAALDAAGMREAADTIVWLVWHRILDEQRHDFLMEDAKTSRADAAADDVAVLREALEPFAACMSWSDKADDDWPLDIVVVSNGRGRSRLKMSDMRRARAALASTQRKEG